MQRMRVESSRKTRHIKKKCGFLFTISYYKLIPLKMFKAGIIQSKAEGEEYATRIRHGIVFKKCPLWRAVSKSCVFGFIIYVWAIAVSVTKKLHFKRKRVCVDLKISEKR